MTEIESAMPYNPENLETLIDNVLHGAGPMSLTDLVNLIARPQSFESSRLVESGASQSVTLALASIERGQSIPQTLADTPPI